MFRWGVIVRMGLAENGLRQKSLSGDFSAAPLCAIGKAPARVARYLRVGVQSTPGGFPSERTTIKYSEQPFDLARFVEVDVVGGGNPRQAGHGHDVAGNHHHELGTSRQPHLAHFHHVIGGGATFVGIG